MGGWLSFPLASSSNLHDCLPGRNDFAGGREAEACCHSLTRGPTSLTCWYLERSWYSSQVPAWHPGQAGELREDNVQLTSFVLPQLCS